MRAFLTLACSPPAARAALNEPEPFTLRDAETAGAAPAPVPDASLLPFDEGSWSIYAHGKFHYDVEREDTTMGVGTFGVGYYFKDNESWNFQLAGYDLQQDGQPDKIGGSFEVIYRNHFINRDPWTIFIEGGAGVFWADAPFPAGGTHQNFTLQAGFGLTYRLKDNVHLISGAQWSHVSNARKRGRERNPHTDGVAFYTGLMWTR